MAAVKNKVHCFTAPDGSKYYYFNGKQHRVDGPAIEFADGYKHWFVDGKRHRIDGPAIEHHDGDKQYYLNGECYSFEEWDRLRKIPWLL